MITFEQGITGIEECNLMEEKVQNLRLPETAVKFRLNLMK